MKIKMIFLAVGLAMASGNLYATDKELVALVELYQKAEQGNAQAQILLGLMYNEGLGVKQDYQKAKELFGKSCDNGNQDGCDFYAKLNKGLK